jgi:hypothetical protein
MSGRTKIEVVCVDCGKHRFYNKGARPPAELPKRCAICNGRWVAKSSGFRPGKDHPQWKGGVRRLQDGYVMIRTDAVYPSGDPVFRPEHVVKAEQALGRPLKRSECVHHINGVREDNRNENLLICTYSYHSALHQRMARLYQEEHFGRPSELYYGQVNTGAAG